MNDSPDAEPAFVAGEPVVVQASGVLCRIRCSLRLRCGGVAAGIVYMVEEPGVGVSCYSQRELLTVGEHALRLGRARGPAASG